MGLYNRKEQQLLICPSGYSISQCFNVLRKMWYAYHKSIRDDKSLEKMKMKKYARAIQNVQKDMGIKTTSFPHLGLYGDQLVLNNKKGERVVFENHSALKEKQEKYEKWQAENAKKIQEKLQKPDIEKGESIQTFVDDVGPAFKDDEDHVDDDDYEDELEKVPDILKPDEEKGEKLVVMTDDIPFIGYYSPKKPEPEENGYD